MSRLHIVQDDMTFEQREAVIKSRVKEFGDKCLLNETGRSSLETLCKLCEHHGQIMGVELMRARMKEL